MRWSIFVVLAYLLLALQLGLKGLMTIETGWGPIEPRFVLLLAVFVGLWATPAVAMTAWAVLGVLLDLTNTWTVAGSDAGLTLIGPYALGYLAGGYALLLLRTVLVRDHPLTLASMAVASGAAVHLIVVAVFTVRAWYEPLAGWSATSELLMRGVSLLYSGVLGLMLAPLMNRLSPVLGIHIARTAATRSRGKRVR